MFRGLSKFRSERSGSQGSLDARRTSGSKNELAITAPKQIIRALYAYEAQHDDELSFTKNDFFYVNSEPSSDWYIASNPLANVTGLVPQSYFEVIQRQDPQAVPISQARRAHSRSASAISGTGSAGPEIVHGHKQSASQSSRSSSRRASLAIYGFVLYDFQAERNDELTVAAGESIVIVAQSTEEWFVAKPIGRLGGPGLIPVSYVEIREVGSDQPLMDVTDAIKRANLPQVDEWKRRLAEYKASSIPLGRFGTTSDQLEQSRLSHAHSRSTSGVNNSYEFSPSSYGHRQTASIDTQANGQAGYGQASKSTGAGPGGPGPSSSAGPAGPSSSSGPSTGSASAGPSGSSGAPYANASSSAGPHSSLNAGHSSLSAGPHGSLYGTARSSAGPAVPYVISATVDRFAVNGGRYWYLVKVEMSNGRYRNLCRYYQDFYDFQIKLLEQFPEEAGRTGKPRTLPFMPGPLTLVTHTVSSQRRANLDDYVRDLIRMPPHVSQSSIVLQLFSVRPGDVESSEATQQLPHPPQSDTDQQYSGDMPSLPGESQPNNSTSTNAHSQSHSQGHSSHSQGHSSHGSTAGSTAATSTHTAPSTGAGSASHSVHSPSSSAGVPYSVPQQRENQYATDREVPNPYASPYGPYGDRNAAMQQSTTKLKQADQPSLKIKVRTPTVNFAILVPVETPFSEVYDKIATRLSMPSPKLYDNDQLIGEPVDNAAKFARALRGGTKIALYLGD